MEYIFNLTLQVVLRASLYNVFLILLFSILFVEKTHFCCMNKVLRALIGIIKSRLFCFRRGIKIRIKNTNRPNSKMNYSKKNSGRNYIHLQFAILPHTSIQTILQKGSFVVQVVYSLRSSSPKENTMGILKYAEEMRVYFYRLNILRLQIIYHLCRHYVTFQHTFVQI